MEDRKAQLDRIVEKIVNEWIAQHPEATDFSEVTAIIVDKLRKSGWTIVDESTTQQKRLISTIINVAHSNSTPQMIAYTFHRFHVNILKSLATLRSVTDERAQEAVRILESVIDYIPQMERESKAALTIRGSNFAIPSQEEYKDVFKPFPKLPDGEETYPDTGIVHLDMGNGDKLEVTKYGLKYNGELVDIVTIGRHISDKPFDLPLIQAVYTMRFQDAEQRKLMTGENLKTGNYTEYAVDPQSIGKLLGRTYGTSTHTGKQRNLATELQNFSNFFAVLNGTKYAMLNVTTVEENCINVISPYFDELCRRSLLKSKIENGKVKISPTHNKLIHGTASRRSQAGLEMAAALTNAMLRRGNTPDKGKDSVTYHIKVQALIDDSATLQQQLANTATSANRNAVLRRAFSAMYQILEEDSDAYTHFPDLQITHTIPTNSTIPTAKITASWSGKKGKNGNTLIK